MASFTFPGQMSESDLWAAAARQAAESVAAEQAGVRTQIPLMRRAGEQQALQATNAASALAQALGVFPGQIQSIFQNAGQAQAGLAQGYTGPLGDQLAADAAQENQLLAALGLPQVVGDQSRNVANVLYGLGGSLPASNLFSQGAGFAAAANALPAAALLQGNLQAGQARSAAQDAILKAQASMAEAAAKNPLYRQQALETLYGRQAQLAGQHNQYLDNVRQDDNARFSQWLQTQQFNESVKQQAIENIRADKALQATLEELGLKKEAEAMDASIRQKELDLRIAEAQAPPAPKIQVRSLADGRQQTFMNGVPVGVPYGPKKESSSKSGKRGATAGQITGWIQDAAELVDQYFYGMVEDPGNPGKMIVGNESNFGEEGSLSYQEAFKTLKTRFPKLSNGQILSLLNLRWTEPGEMVTAKDDDSLLKVEAGGRPFFSMGERARLRKRFTKRQINLASRPEARGFIPVQDRPGYYREGGQVSPLTKQMLRFLGRAQ